KSPADFEQLYKNSPVAAFKPKFIEFVRANPQDDSSKLALLWLFHYVPCDPDAYNLIAKYWIEDDIAGDACVAFCHDPPSCPFAEDFSHRILSQSTNSINRAKAALSLGFILAQKAPHKADKMLRLAQRLSGDTVWSEYCKRYFAQAATIADIADKQ